MGRMLSSMLVLISVVLLFHFGGLLSASFTPTGYILNNLGLLNPENMGSTTMFLTLLGLTTLGVAGIVIGSLFRLDPNSLILISIGVPLATVMFAMFWDLIMIFNILKDTSYMLAVMIVSPMMIAWIITIYDFLRGRD